MARQTPEGSLGGSKGGVRKSKPKALTAKFLRFYPVQTVDDRRLVLN
jgi:hypothetical protein